MPTAQEVLVHVQANSVNPADWHRMRGEPRFMRLSEGLFKPKKPILGADIAGTVVAVGPAVKHFQVGDRVYGELSMGGFAEYATATEEQIAKKPANCSMEEMAAVPIAGLTALQALRDYGQLQKGQTVLINGASGGVGTFAVQLAKAMGAEVTAVASGRNQELLHSIGADHTINYSKTDFARQGKRYDLILELVGDRTAVELCQTLQANGTALMVGFSTMGHMLRYMLRAGWISKRSSKTLKTMLAKPNRTDLETLAKAMESGQIRAVIDKRYPFSQIPEAITYLETRRARGKVVITH